MTEQHPANIKSVLITGSAGFLGSRLVRSFATDGIPVRAAYHSAHPGERSRRSANVDYLRLDLRDRDDVLKEISEQDLVIHAASVMSGSDGDLQRDVNVAGTQNVVDACIKNGIPRLIYIGSTATVGRSLNPMEPADESLSFDPKRRADTYATTKHLAEQLVLNANGPVLQTVTVNPGFMFGAHEHGYRGNQVIERVLRRRFVLCTGGTLSIVHVDDVVDGIRKVAACGAAGERYILSGDNVSFRQIAETVSRVSAQPRVIVSVPDGVFNVARHLIGALARSPVHALAAFDTRLAYQSYSSEKARAELGYQSRPFQEIVAEYLEDQVAVPLVSISRSTSASKELSSW